MIMEFKTKPDKNGNISYLCFSTIMKEYTRNPKTMVCNGIVVRKKDIRELRRKLDSESFKEV